MTKTIAIFGFGPGLGMGTARRFGREGFRIAVIGRDPVKAKAHVEDLAAQGITATAYTADVMDEAQVFRVVDEITGATGPIDVAMHGAAAEMADRVASTLAVEPAALRIPLTIKLYSPMWMVRALAPAMIERGDGALLFSSGHSTRHVQPYLGNFGIALGAQHAYVQQLAAELRDSGVYVGLLSIGALIGASKAERLIEEHPELIPPGLEIVRMTNDELGERYWRMYTERDRVEVEVGFPS
ncbi:MULTISPECIES: SDR family oxidoreductase [unclassified Nocardia]|uniref:SDR family NAD(P)-dependent oxidoreductase n=1 Tax=unclassified Nocardia TaxID=2637762 RepID=UPI001CE450DA|nr:MULTISPECIES: SDR family oxidoreductase [unclassified Nocardia]